MIYKEITRARLDPNDKYCSDLPTRNINKYKYTNMHVHKTNTWHIHKQLYKRCKLGTSVAKRVRGG